MNEIKIEKTNLEKKDEEIENLNLKIDKLKSKLESKNKLIKELVNGLKRAKKLLSCLTIREVLENGMEDEAGINPYCVNDGMADGDDYLICLWLECLINEHG